MFALVSPSISSARLIAIAARCAIARAISVSSSVNGRRGGAPAHSNPSRSPPEISGVTSRSATSSSGHSVRAGGRDALPSNAASSNAVADSASGSAVVSGDEDSSCRPEPSRSMR